MSHAPNRGTGQPESSIRDAVHGLVDISDLYAPGPPIIAQLIQSRAIQRLRRIKQLGFASQSYVAADHSRYAHALGTMHVMRNLLKQVGGARSSFRTTLLQQYEEAYEPPEPITADFLYQHVLVAALLQDIGELPYQNATTEHFVPDEDLRDWVGGKIDQDVSLWPSKAVFNLGCLLNADLQAILEPLNLHFIAFLMSAESWSDSAWQQRFMPLRHMLDGEIDADRIDYVHRDAHHTVGGLSTSHDVVSAILSYDDSGPICSDPAPLGNFLATRAHLYSIVYFAPQNRFRVMLLSSIIDGIRKLPDAFHTSSLIATREVGIESFLELDDVRLEAEINNVKSSQSRRRLDKKTSIALSEFTTASSAYAHFWLRESNQSSSVNGATVPIPNEIFFETFEASTPKPSGIRFETTAPTGETELAAINDMNGPYFEVVRSPRVTMPILGDVLMFYPQHDRGRDFAALKKSYRMGTLRSSLLAKKRSEWGGIPADTRRSHGYTGLSVFISYCVDDTVHVQRIVRELHNSRRRYYVILEPNQGIGGTTAQNSIDGVMQTDCCIIVASRAYQGRCSKQLNGNIMHEIRTMHDRRIPNPDSYPVVPVSIHRHEEVANIPWSLLGMSSPPFTGTVLEHATESELRTTVAAAIAALDSRMAEK
ncbi:HD superfamily phosphohydrolase [Lentzea waywayandensis]|uniref:HD superfamily phosphohydrolase n=2 Tax=Lentzea waywayandensis TaxID=84724 RepID=A0A1I6CUE4_9PSEU|nr:HD superfamily phosphohydrolase [Lentzea waywayandensis]